jgi:hypothetical protein
LFRSALSENVAITMDNAVGAMIAADSPWTDRAATSTSADQAAPQPIDDAMNSASPAMKTRRLPSRSAMRPKNSIRPAKVNA